MKAKLRVNLAALLKEAPDRKGGSGRKSKITVLLSFPTSFQEEVFDANYELDCLMVFKCKFLSVYCLKSAQMRFFSDPYFPAFRLNTERYSVPLRIQSECGKRRNRKNSLFGHFLRSGFFKSQWDSHA